MKTSGSQPKGNEDLIKRINTANDNYKSVDFKILQFVFLAVIIAAVFTFNPVGIGIAVATYTAVAVNESVRSYLSIKRIANDFPGSPASKMLKRQAFVLAFATLLNFATFYISNAVGDNVSDKSMLAGLRVGPRGYVRIERMADRIERMADSELDQNALKAGGSVSQDRQAPRLASELEPSAGLGRSKSVGSSNKSKNNPAQSPPRGPAPF